MSDHHQRPPILIRPARSYWLLLFLIVMHLLAAIAVLLTPLQFWPRLGLALLVVLSLGYRIWASVLGKAPWSVREVVLSAQGWRLALENGRSLSATLLPSTVITVWLVVLNFRVGWWRHYSLVLTTEVMTPDALRRLRARLRLEQGSL